MTFFLIVILKIYVYGGILCLKLSGLLKQVIKSTINQNVEKNAMFSGAFVEKARPLY